MTKVTLPRLLMALTMLGIALRLLIAFYSVGSNDATTWYRFGYSVLDNGLIETYRQERRMNHPPLSGLWSSVIARLNPSRGALFFPLFKLPVIAADIGCMWLLVRIWRKQSATHAWAAAVLFALSPLAISIGSYHCNTDNICAFFTLLAFYYATERQNFWRAGLALGAAVNIKLIPLFLVFPLYAVCKTRSDIKWLTAAYALSSLPFLIVMAQIPHIFIKRVIKYNSSEERWGTGLFIEHFPPPDKLYIFYIDQGRYLLLLMSMALAYWAWRGRAASPYHLGAATMVGFLLFSPGFGVQYLIMALPLLFAANIGLATAYGLSAGAFSILLYIQYWVGDFPPYSRFIHPFSPEAGKLGLVAYAVLIISFWRLLTARRRQHSLIKQTHSPA